MTAVWAALWNWDEGSDGFGYHGEPFLGSIGAFGGGVVGYVVPFLFVLTVVVFFHELGHFLVARWCGIKVLVFSLGFGPEIVGFNDSHGTRWKLSAIPLGGYVKFFGDDNAASVPDHAAAAAMTDAERNDSFVHKSVGKRAAVVAAGPIANFILAIVIFAGIFMIVGKPNMQARVDAIIEGGAAEAAGFQPGDLVLSIDGAKIDTFSDMQRIVSMSADQKLAIEVKRGDATVTLQATPQLQVRTSSATSWACSVSAARWRPATRRIEKLGPVAAVAAGAQGDLVHHRPHVVLYRRHFHRPRTRRPARRTDPNRPGVRPGRDRRIRPSDPPDSRAVSLDRPSEPVSDPAARWRSPFVLWY